MAKKIDGYIYTDDAAPSLIRNGALTFYNRLEHHVERAATLVMHDGKKHERVFTESEVRAKDEDLRWALTWISNEARHLRERGERQLALEAGLDMLLERHGIVLDPA